MWPDISLALLLSHGKHITHITIVHVYVFAKYFLSMFVQEEHHLEVEIESGINDDMESKFANKGEPHMDNKLRDLILKIITEPFSN